MEDELLDLVNEHDPHDFASAEWLTPQELLTKLESGVPAKINMLETVSALM